MTIEASETILADGKVAQNVVVVGSDGVVSEGATLTEQEAQTALLADIEANTNGLLKNDTEVPFTWFKVIQAFTDAVVDDIIVSYVLLNTTTGVGTPYTKRWRGWIDIVIPSPVDNYVVDMGGGAITLAQMQSLGLATSAKQDDLTTLLTPKTYTDASSTITLGGTAQALLVANASRTGVSFMNISDTDMYLNPTGTATTGAGSFLIRAGGTYVTDHGAKDSQEISILCATTGKAFTCKWW